MTDPAGGPILANGAAGSSLQGSLATLFSTLTPRRLGLSAAIIVLIVAGLAGVLILRHDRAEAWVRAGLSLQAQSALAVTLLADGPPRAPEALTEALRPTLLPGQAAAIIDAAGAPLAIAPAGEPATQAFAATPPARLGTADVTLTEISLPGGEHALVATVAIGNGQTLGLAVPASSVLAGPDGRLPLLLILLIAVGAGVTALAGLLTHEMRRSDALGRTLRVRQSRFEGAFTELTVRAAEMEEHIRDELAAKEAEIDAAREAADEAQRVKADLLAAASHELRTPLNAVLGFSEIMTSGILGPLGHPKYEEYIRDVHRSGRQLLYAVDGLLAMARIERGRSSLKPEAVDLAGVAHECAALVRQYAEEHQVRIVGSTGRPPPVVADVSALRQSVMNVLVNAVQYTPGGGRVTIACEVHDADVSLTIRDTGLGIADPDLARLGAPFERANGSKGLGLGLAVAKSLTELMGGRFRIESVVEEGTAVTLCLPIAAQGERPASEDATGEPDVAPALAEDDAAEIEAEGHAARPAA